MRWLPSAGSVLAFARGQFVCLVNFGPEAVELPSGADVLLASDELEGGALKQDTTVWLTEAGPQHSVG
jgi:alpha-glucosidase